MLKKLIHINTDDKRRTQSQNWVDEDAPQAIQDPEYDKMNPYEKDIYDILFSIPFFRYSADKLPYTIRKYIESEGDWEKFIDKYDESKGLQPDYFRTDLWIRQHINLFPRFDQEKENQRLRKILDEQYTRAKERTRKILAEQKADEESKAKQKADEETKAKQKADEETKAKQKADEETKAKQKADVFTTSGNAVEPDTLPNNKKLGGKKTTRKYKSGKKTQKKNKRKERK
jgi:hypothetical protein